MDYLSSLNKIQRQAVEQTDGPVMIIAGPGSGKTRVLTYRIAHLIAQGTDAFNILALTFTNKAAREMKARIEGLQGTEARNIWMGTFHSVFSRILRVQADKIGYPNNFTIYDTQDSKSLIKNIVKERGLNDKLYKPNNVFYRISMAKNELIGPEQYIQNPILTSDDESNGRPMIGELYREYAKRCYRAGAMDFDDLLFKTHELIDNHPDVLHKYQHYFRYIMIDEFQDTNHVQYAIVKRLADVFQNIAVVGDDAQSIYSFRGANIRNILDFERDFPELKVFKLEQNYRSSKVIVETANSVIAKNKDQLAKKIWTDNPLGQKIKILRAMSDNEEGRLVVDTIFDLKMHAHLHNRDIAILYRTNAQSRSFEESLRRLNIPYRIYGGLSFYQRKEIKDLLAYLKLTVNPQDEESFRRVINYPARGIGKTSLEQLTVMAAEQDCSLWELCVHIGQLGFSGRSKNAIQNFVLMMQSFMAMAAHKDAYELASHIARQSGLVKELYNDKSVEGLSRYENFQELLNSIKEFADQTGEVIEGEALPEQRTLGGYLQQVSLLTDQDEGNEKEDSVKLMTIHAAKGLEFGACFVVGMEENLFPSMLSLSSREELEEERRLFYVAITRAEKFVYLSHAATRYRYGNLIYCEPSRFLEDLPDFHIEHVGVRSPKARPKRERTTASRPQPQKPAPPNYIHKPTEGFLPDDPSKLSVGMRIEHQRFGFGKIVGMEGAAGNRMATIFFKEVGQKKLLLKFAKLRLAEASTS